MIDVAAGIVNYVAFRTKEPFCPFSNAQEGMAGMPTEHGKKFVSVFDPQTIESFLSIRQTAGAKLATLQRYRNVLQSIVTFLVMNCLSRRKAQSVGEITYFRRAMR